MAYHLDRIRLVGWSAETAVFAGESVNGLIYRTIVVCVFAACGNTVGVNERTIQAQDQLTCFPDQPALAGD